MMNITKTNYGTLLNIAYRRYKEEWCKVRGYSLDNVDEKIGFNGEIYACKEEFENAEFAIRSYMKTLLSEENFQLWELFVKQGEIDVIYD